jgi:hypothetical protein
MSASMSASGSRSRSGSMGGGASMSASASMRGASMSGGAIPSYARQDSVDSNCDDDEYGEYGEYGDVRLEQGMLRGGMRASELSVASATCSTRGAESMSWYQDHLDPAQSALTSTVSSSTFAAHSARAAGNGQSSSRQSSPLGVCWSCVAQSLCWPAPRPPPPHATPRGQAASFSGRRRPHADQHRTGGARDRIGSAAGTVCTLINHCYTVCALNRRCSRYCMHTD